MLTAQNSLVELWQASEYISNHSLKGETIAVDKYQNTYMISTQSSVGFVGYLLVKYDSTGLKLWERYSAPSLGLIYGSFTVDSVGNVFVGKLFDNLPGLEVDAVIIRYDSEGEVVWEKNYGLNQTGNSGIYYSMLDSSGHLIAFGLNKSDMSLADNFMFVSCIDTSTGSEIWRTKFPGFYNCQNLRVLSDRIELLATEFKPSTKYYTIAQLDFDGQLIQRHSKPYETAQHLIDFNYINKAGEVILGNRGFGYTVTKLSTTGDTLWSYELPEGSGLMGQQSLSVVEDEDSNVYVCGVRPYPTPTSPQEMLTSKFSAEGALLWQKSNHLWDDLGTAGGWVSVDERFAYVIGGSGDTTGNSLLTVVVYDKSSGDESYVLYLKGEKVFNGTSLIPLNGKIVYTGFTHEGIPQTTNSVTGMIKIPEIMSSTNHPLAIPSANIFPNPAIEYLNITQIDPSIFSDIDLLDFNGRLIFSQKVTAEAMVITLPNHTNSNYLLVLRGDKARVCKKIACIK